MIISCIVGGLGNQLFQYAVGKHLAMRNNETLTVDYGLFQCHRQRHPQLFHFNVDCREIDDLNFASSAETEMRSHFKLPPAQRSLARRVARQLRSRLWRRPLVSAPLFWEKSPRFDAALLDLEAPVRLIGFWQSEKYFLGIESTIRRDLQIKAEYLKNTDRVLEKIGRTRAVSVHFRRGDYVGLNKFEMRNPLDYYQNAVKDMAQHVEDATFYVFSDDVAWVKQHFQSPHRMVYVNEDGVLTDVEELHLMKSCRHHIIANSTFSWWGAWLNPDPHKRVYAPRIWFNDDKDYSDVVPENWLRL